MPLVGNVVDVGAEGWDASQGNQTWGQAARDATGAVAGGAAGAALGGLCGPLAVVCSPTGGVIGAELGTRAANSDFVTGIPGAVSDAYSEVGDLASPMPDPEEDDTAGGWDLSISSMFGGLFD